MPASSRKNRIAIKLVSPNNTEHKTRFYNCARVLKKTLEREMKFVSTVGEEAPRPVGDVAALSEIDDVIWVRNVVTEDIVACKSLIQLTTEKTKLRNQVLITVNPEPRLFF